MIQFATKPDPLEVDEVAEIVVKQFLHSRPWVTKPPVAIPSQPSAEVFIVTCIACKEEHGYVVAAGSFARWVIGSLIQNVWPKMPVSERELIQSGYCGTCFDALFANDEDED